MSPQHIPNGPMTRFLVSRAQPPSPAPRVPLPPLLLSRFPPDRAAGRTATPAGGRAGTGGRVRGRGAQRWGGARGRRGAFHHCRTACCTAGMGACGAAGAKEGRLVDESKGESEGGALARRAWAAAALGVHVRGGCMSWTLRDGEQERCCTGGGYYDITPGLHYEP